VEYLETSKVVLVLAQRLTVVWMRMWIMAVLACLSSREESTGSCMHGHLRMALTLRDELHTQSGQQPGLVEYDGALTASR